MAIITATLATTLVASVKDYLVEMASEQVLGAEKKQDYHEKLDALQKGQIKMIRRLASIEQRLIQMQIDNATAVSFDTILVAYRQLCDYDKEHQEDTNKWVDKVLDPTDGIQVHLYHIDNVVMGSSSLDKPLIQKFLEMLSVNKQHTQSDYYLAIAYIQYVTILQMMGQIVYINAYRYRNGKESDDTNILKLYGTSISQQMDFNREVIAGADQWYHNPEFGSSYFSIGGWGDARYFHLYPNVTPQGRVLTGINFYQKENRMALSIRHALLGDEYTEVQAEASGWQEDNDFGQQQGVHYVDGSDFKFVHMEALSAPKGHVLTGAQLTTFHNRIAIKIQIAAINQEQKSIDESSRKWLEPSIFAEDNYYEIAGDDTFANSHPAAPEPPSLVNGAGLIKFNNRLAIQLMTSFDKL